MSSETERTAKADEVKGARSTAVVATMERNRWCGSVQRVSCALERDEDLIESLCDILETNAFQIKRKVEDLKIRNDNQDIEKTGLNQVNVLIKIQTNMQNERRSVGTQSRTRVSVQWALKTNYRRQNPRNSVALIVKASTIQPPGTVDQREGSIVAYARSRGAVEALEDQDVTERIRVAVVCPIKTEEFEWLEEFQRDENWSHVIKLWINGKLVEVIEINGMKGPVRVSDFVLEHSQLKMFQEDGSLVLIVLKSVRFDLFLRAHAGVLARHRQKDERVQNLLSKPSQKNSAPPSNPVSTTKLYDIAGVDLVKTNDIGKSRCCKTTFPSLRPNKCTEFENKITEELEKVANIKHVFRKGYNPRENGITEGVNGTIVAMLRKTTKIPTEWDERLLFCMKAYNMTSHSSNGESHYFILHGIDPTTHQIPSPYKSTQSTRIQKSFDFMDWGAFDFMDWGAFQVTI
uniref:Integrase catalytic domain-containing protein n=1 Tax=Haemonchus placei TaxID=6290 RepID=A0A158QKE6_HAEPC